MRGLFTIIPLAFVAANLYIMFRFWCLMPPNTAGRVALVAFFAAAVGSLFLGMRFEGSLSVPLASAMYRFGTAWLIISMYMLMVFLVLDLGRLVRLLPMDFLSGSWPKFWIMAGIAAAIMLFGYINYANKARRELTIELPGSKGEKPLKIVAVSDLHLGYGIGSGELERWVRLINAEEPDLVVIAGDAIDNSLRPLKANGTGNILRGIKATYGVFAVPGNHEYIAGIDRSVEFLEDAGVTVLRDSAVTIAGRFRLAGRDDRRNRRRMPLEELMGSLPGDGLPVILLDHQPYDLDRTAEQGVLFQFSGHTHHGQVWPFSLVTERMYENAHGLMRKGGTSIYVSSGMGIWGGKLRIGTRSEYLVVTVL